MSDDRTILLQFIASLTLCDHMGDVSNDVSDVLKKLGPPYDSWEWDEWHDLSERFRQAGITTLNGTEFSPPDE